MLNLNVTRIVSGFRGTIAIAKSHQRPIMLSIAGAAGGSPVGISH